ncbi:response regulator transcription factor [Frigidibacter oleivorans]|uniref:response regulator transcription factor n=1 Tax=Frigidibacter oleivorans TaxID=2487129 RepID=UPI000F8EF35E|nr:response regulator transcription factor [Frigidibacter oleivorans]
MSDDTTGILNVLIADDHAMILEMFEMYLANVPDIALTTTTDLDGALKKIEENGFYDLVLVDLDMPGMNGLTGLTRAIQANGGKPVAILTGGPSPRMVDDIMAHGASGVVVKTTSLRSLANAIRFMASGERYVPLELLHEKNRAHASIAVPLSDREMMVLARLVEGMPNREIGAALNLAEPTIKMHVKSICKKLGVSNRTQAVIASRDLKLI